MSRCRPDCNGRRALVKLGPGRGFSFLKESLTRNGCCRSEQTAERAWTMADTRQADFIKQMELLRGALKDSHIVVTEEQLTDLTTRMIEGQEADRITDAAI